MATYAPFQVGMTTGGTWTYVGSLSPNPTPPATYDGEIDFTGFAAGLYTYRYTVTDGSDTHSADIIINWQGDGTAPSNDDCVGSTFITGITTCPGSGVKAYSTAKQCSLGIAAPTDSGISEPAQWTLPSYTGDVWFYVKPPSCATPYSITFSLDGNGNSSDAKGVALAVYSGTCDLLKLEGASSASVGGTSTSVDVSIPSNSVGNYWVRISSNVAGSGLVSAQCSSACESTSGTMSLYYTSYVDDAAAQVAGIDSCMPYRLSQVNNYGGISPGSKVLFLTREGGCVSYADDAAAAAAGISLGQIYAISQVNNYGLASPGGRLAVVRTDGGSVSTFKGPFANDSAAALGGVVIGEPYLAAPVNDYNAPSGQGRTLIVRTS